MRLEETLHLTEGRIEVDYRLVSPLPHEVYVLDAPFAMEGGRPVLRESLVHTLIEGDLLRLVRAALAIPHGVQVEAPEMPYARRLPAGGTLTGRIAAPLPLAYDNPYDLSDGEQIHRCSRVVLVVGWVPAPALPSPPARVEGVAGAELYRIPYRAAMAAQQRVESPVHEAPVTVYRRP